MLPPCTVVAAGEPARVWVHVPDGSPARPYVRLEDGGVRTDLVQVDHWVPPQDVDGVLVGEATFALPEDLPLGWHSLVLDGAVAPLVVTPARLEPLPAAERLWGFLTQLYSVRSTRSWGVGDLRDLADLAAWSGHELGAGFVLVNPLHAAAPLLPVEPSPYLPTTRRFVSPLYLRVEDVPEAGLPRRRRPGRAVQVGGGARRHRRARRAAGPRPRVGGQAARAGAARPGAALAGPSRRAAGVPQREGAALVDFATWSALTEELATPWPEWPAELHDPRSPAVAVGARAAVPTWSSCTCARSGGWTSSWPRPSAPPGTRAWRSASCTTSPSACTARASTPGRCATCSPPGSCVGAPPDAFNQQGQTWSQPPWRPDALAEAGYAPYRDMLRTVLRHAGGLRIDHVLGLFRLWWVPEGVTPADGTYVRYDHEALVGILALEAHRAGAFVVGEDLGTVEPWVRDVLRERGILGTSVLWFERGQSGEPLAPEHWRRLCLATVTTHDLPPTAGYLRGEHLRIRAGLGLLVRPEDEERAGTTPTAPPGRTRCARAACCARAPASGRPSRRCTGTSPRRPRGCSAWRSPTRSATCARRTSRAPDRSTRTGCSRWPTGTADRCCSRTLAASERVRSLARSVHAG